MEGQAVNHAKTKINQVEKSAMVEKRAENIIKQVKNDYEENISNQAKRRISQIEKDANNRREEFMGNAKNQSKQIENEIEFEADRFSDNAKKKINQIEKQKTNLDHLTDFDGLEYGKYTKNAQDRPPRTLRDSGLDTDVHDFERSVSVEDYTQEELDTIATIIEQLQDFIYNYGTNEEKKQSNEIVDALENFYQNPSNAMQLYARLEALCFRSSFSTRLNSNIEMKNNVSTLLHSLTKEDTVDV